VVVAWAMAKWLSLVRGAMGHMHNATGEPALSRVVEDYAVMLRGQPGLLALGYDPGSSIDVLKVLVVVDKWDSPSVRFAHKAAGEAMDRYSDQGIDVYIDVMVIPANGRDPMDLMPEEYMLLLGKN